MPSPSSTPSGAALTVVYSDGACSGNPGPGGWAWVVPEGAFASGYDPATTNQRMEITAAFEAVRAIEGPMEIVSDSTYVVNCFRDRWWEGWLARGWLNSQRKPVANRDLWEPFVALVRERGDVRFRWVKGHAGDRWNDLADRLAVDAVRSKAGRTGDRPPDASSLGAPDVVVAPGASGGASASGNGASGNGASGNGASAEAVSYRDGIAGHPLVVLGHQPPELGGYDPNPTATAVRRRLRDIVAAKATLHPDLVVVTGLRLGAEQLAAEAAVEADVPFVAILPFPDPDAAWPAARRTQFAALRDGARDVLVLQKKRPETTQQVAAAMTRRDAWLARHAAEAVLVWDGEDPRLGRLHRSLVDHLGDDVWLLRPQEL